MGFIVVCAYLAPSLSEKAAGNFIVQNMPPDMCHRPMIMIGDLNQSAQTNAAFLKRIETVLGLDLAMPKQAT